MADASPGQFGIVGVLGFSAVAIASVSLRSFLLVRRLRNGVTNCAAIRRGTRPYSLHRRAQ